jgi:hypothetical protein
MQAIIELMGNAEGYTVADAGRVADLDDSVLRFFRHPESVAGGTAHEHMGAVAVNEDRWGAEVERTEVSAQEFNFAERKRSRRSDRIDSGLGECFAGGLCAGARHVLRL